MTMNIITNRPIITEEQYNSDYDLVLSEESYSEARGKRKKRSDSDETKSTHQKNRETAKRNRKTSRETAKEMRSSNRIDAQSSRQKNRIKRQADRAAKKLERIKTRPDRDRKMLAWWKGKKKDFKANRTKKKNARELELSPASEQAIKTNPLAQGEFMDTLPVLIPTPDGTALKTLPDGTTEVIPAAQVTTVTSPEGTPYVVDQNDYSGKVVTFEDDEPVVFYNEDDIIEVVDDQGKAVIVAENQVEEGWKGLSKGKKALIIGGSIVVLAAVTILIIKLTKKK